MSDKSARHRLPLATSSVVAPSPSFLRRIIGEPLSAKTAQGWPELEKSWAGRQIEMPNESAKVTNIGEMGMLSKLRYPNAYAATGPFGTVKLNRELIDREKADIDDVLVHELAHVGQGPMGFVNQLFGSAKPENDAINREAFRKVRKTDINLNAPRVPRIK